MPPDWRLVLAGAPSGFGAEAILERVHARIEVTGYLAAPQLEQLYARASIFAFPSLDEGFGIPVLEAMAHGLPAITSNCSALPEVAGDAALLVDPRSSADIAAALTRLATDADLREQLAARGRERAKIFSWEQAVAATYSIYQGLLH